MIENLFLGFLNMTREGERKDVVLRAPSRKATAGYIRGRPGTDTQKVFMEERETWGKQETFEVKN